MYIVSNPYFYFVSFVIGIRNVSSWGLRFHKDYSHSLYLSYGGQFLVLGVLRSCWFFFRLSFSGWSFFILKFCSRIWSWIVKKFSLELKPFWTILRNLLNCVFWFLKKFVGTTTLLSHSSELFEPCSAYIFVYVKYSPLCTLLVYANFVYTYCVHCL